MSDERIDSIRLPAQCDLSCWFCSGPLGATATQPLPQLPKPGDRATTLRVIGCDPMRRADLTTWAARAKAAGYSRVCVETNGVRLAATGAAAALTRAGLDEVVVTGYSDDATVHDRVCGRSGAHGRLMQGLAEARAAGLDISLRIVFLSAEKQDAAALLRSANTHAGGVDSVELSLPRAVPPGSEAQDFLCEDLTQLRGRLLAAVQQTQAIGAELRFAPESGIPLCALPEAAHEKAVVQRRASGMELSMACQSCAAAAQCAGLPAWYLDRHGDDALVPLAAPVARATPPRTDAHPAFHKDAVAKRPGRFRLVLINLSEATWGYGPGACEYLRAAVLSQPELAERVDVDILFLVGLSDKAAADAIQAAQPDLVGLSAYSWNLAQCGAVSRLLKARKLAAPIVWGGVSFAFLNQDASWFSWWDAVDAIAHGSGEHTLVDLTRTLLRQNVPRRIPRGMPGLYTVHDGQVGHGPPALVPNLDDFPSPYLEGTVYRVARPTIEMARGCIFSCAFCSDAKQSREGRMQLRGSDRLASEIAAVVAWPESQWIDAGASTANVTDAAFARTCEAIRRGDPNGKLRYGFQLYPSLARDSQREALRGVPVGALHFGVQSLSPDTFAPMKRGTRLQHIERALKTFSGAGPLELSMILGLPGETLESFRNSFDRVLSFDAARVVVNRLLVLPGTQLHLHRAVHGLGVDAQRYYRVTHTSSMSAADLRRAQDYVIERTLALPSLDDAGEARVRWVGFDVQQSFAAPPEYAGRIQ